MTEDFITRGAEMLRRGTNPAREPSSIVMGCADNGGLVLTIQAGEGTKLEAAQRLTQLARSVLENAQDLLAEHDDASTEELASEIADALTILPDPNADTAADAAP